MINNEPGIAKGFFGFTAENPVFPVDNIPGSYLRVSAFNRFFFG
jgi:hypothetical protein